MTKILVIEDEIDSLDNICKILQSDGYEAIQAEDGEIGIEMAHKHLPDLILCDIRMPNKTGYEVLEELQKDAETSEIPFIFLTVFSNKENVVKGFELGAQDYVSKPFDNKELLARIKTHLKLRNLTKSLKKIIDDLYSQIKRLEKDRENLEEKLKNMDPEKEVVIAKLKGQIEAKDDIIKNLIDIKKSL
jgi:DNA-binding response OmpR family regulator